MAAKIRGDDSFSDILRLNEMQKISITNRELSYGIDVDTMFWVKEGILSRDTVRKSQDEELVADIVAYMVSDDPISSRTEMLDDFYGSGRDTASITRFNDIENAVQRRSVEFVVLDFLRVLDQVKLTLSASGLTFSQILFPGGQDNPIPRYFQVVFLALYDLIVRQELEVTDRAALINALTGTGPHINVQGGGGRWGADNRQRAIEAATGMYQRTFGPATQLDPAKVLWITQLQNLLTQSYTEQSAYDFKQGFLILSDAPSFDEASFEKILKTLVAISNLGKDRIGYVLVGIAENSATAARVEQLYHSKPFSYQSFWITGVDHEAVKLGKSADEFFQWITDKVRTSGISEPLKGYIASNIKPVRYYDKTVYVFKTSGMSEPSRYDDEYFERKGAQLEKVEPSNLGSLFIRYLNS